MFRFINCHIFFLFLGIQRSLIIPKVDVKPRKLSSATPVLASTDDDEIVEVRWTPRAPIRRRTKSAARAKSPNIKQSILGNYGINGHSDYISMNRGISSPNQIIQPKEKISCTSLENTSISSERRELSGESCMKLQDLSENLTLGMN